MFMPIERDGSQLDWFYQVFEPAWVGLAANKATMFSFMKGAKHWFLSLQNLLKVRLFFCFLSSIFWYVYNI